MRIDYTGKLTEFNQYDRFNNQVTVELRNSRFSNGEKILLLADWGFAFETPVPHLVADHLNLAGSNPLVGPNDPIGDRFPVATNLYLVPKLTPKPSGIAAGL